MRTEQRQSYMLLGFGILIAMALPWMLRPSARPPVDAAAGADRANGDDAAAVR